VELLWDRLISASSEEPSQPISKRVLNLLTLSNHLEVFVDLGVDALVLARILFNSQTEADDVVQPRDDLLDVRFRVYQLLLPS